MKKLGLFVLSILLVLPFSVNAATLPAVKTLEATVSGSTVSYNGTMEDGSYAVMCKLFDKDDKEVDKLSSQVDSNKFEGSFTKVANGTYNVVCANYEGGDVKKEEVTVTDSTETPSSPNTYDAGITTSLIIVGISGIAIVGSVLYLRKKNN